VTIQEIADVLKGLGCPSEKCTVMAAQLDKRARMDSASKGISYEAALSHLVSLMSQGWASSKKSS
jgi:hypothetical protein